MHNDGSQQGSSSGHFDVVVVGGGIVGAATLYKLQKRFPERRMLLIDKMPRLADHQTGNNSGVIHSGLYYKPGSLKATNCVQGRRELVQFCKDHDVPHDVCGKVVVAADASELPMLEKIHGIGQQNGIEDLERIDALASWIENLRDVLIAGDQPVGAINATVATCPGAIKPQVRRLAAGLGRQDPAIVFRRFADEIDDPLGDLIAAGLLIAVQRGARTAAVLSSLADQARRQADRRRLVEAERAPVKREVTVLTTIMASLAVGLLVFGRAEYLEPYNTSQGQLFLGLILAAYAALLLRVQRLAHFPRPSRFLTAGTERTEGRPSTVAASAPPGVDP